MNADAAITYDSSLIEYNHSRITINIINIIIIIVIIVIIIMIIIIVIIVI